MASCFSSSFSLNKHLKTLFSSGVKLWPESSCTEGQDYPISLRKEGDVSGKEHGRKIPVEGCPSPIIGGQIECM